MKSRNGFVSNSSSSSFIINKKNLTGMQLYAIKNHYQVSEEYFKDFLNKYNDCYSYGDRWWIEENDKYITGYTSLDNFSMDEFFKLIDIPDMLIKWKESEISLNVGDTIYSKEDDISIYNTLLKSISDWHKIKQEEDEDD